jgi:hypothetical protein
MASSTTADFIHRLRNFVQHEADAQREALSRQWAQPLSDRVAKGWTVEGLRSPIFRPHLDSPDPEGAQSPQWTSVSGGRPHSGFPGPRRLLESTRAGSARSYPYHLRHSYRSTREIMQFATLLYRLRLAEEKDDDILVPDLLNMPSGAFPEIIPLTSPQDEITRIANEVAGFVKRGYPKRHLLLFHTDGQGVRSLIQAIDERLGKNAAFDPKDTYPGDYVRVTTLNAGAGLESPIVFLAGLRQLFSGDQMNIAINLLRTGKIQYGSFYFF